MFYRLFLGLAAATLLCAQTTPAGHWEGTIKPEGREIGLSLDLAQNQKGEWIASMGVPSENATGLVVKDLAVDGKSVKFMAVEMMMSTVDLKLGDDGKLTGTITNPRSTLPIEFRRTGEAKVQLLTPSPAVSKELEGDWEGSLKTPNGSELKLTVHFKNLPDKTVSATIDIPATNAIGMPINDVKQTGEKVEFGLKIAHGSFRGAMNKEGTEIVGQLVHEEEGAPLTLRKK